MQMSPLKRMWARLGRYSPLVAGFFLITALPLLVLLFAPSGKQTAENRRLASPPALPLSLAAMRDFPAKADAWAVDHFGLRDLLIRLNNFVLWRAFGELHNDRLIAGRHDRLFLGAHDGAPLDSLITDACGATQPAGTVTEAAASIRTVLVGLRAAGLDPTLLVVPTAARLYPEDLPARFTRRCAGHSPPADRLAALLAGQDVLYPLAPMLTLKRDGIPPIPPNHFHWAGEAPLRIAEEVAEGHWGLRRQVALPLRWIGRTSDLSGMNPGMGLSDSIREPQVRMIGLTDCVMQACANEAGLSPGAARALEHYRRPGAGPELVIIADSFGDEIARDFAEQFADIWLVHTNISDELPAGDQAAIAGWIQGRFRGRHMLLVYHDMAAVSGLGPVETLLHAMRGAVRPD